MSNEEIVETCGQPNTSTGSDQDIITIGSSSDRTTCFAAHDDVVDAHTIVASVLAHDYAASTYGVGMSCTVTYQYVIITCGVADSCAISQEYVETTGGIGISSTTTSEEIVRSCGITSTGCCSRKEVIRSC